MHSFRATIVNYDRVLITVGLAFIKINRIEHIKLMVIVFVSCKGASWIVITVRL